MPLHIPTLARKLQCLYQRHPAINNHEALARHLGIAPNNISVWINGNDVRAPEMVPNRHIRPLSELFSVQPQWLETPSFERFTAFLGEVPTAHSPWERLRAEARRSETIRLIRPEPEPAEGLRGLVPADAEALECFYVGEHLYLQVDLPDAWHASKRTEATFILLLSVDPAATSCLCPSALAPEPQALSHRILVPQAAPRRHLKVAGPPGLQSVFLLLSAWRLDEGLYKDLVSDLTPAVLDRVAAAVRAQPADTWQLWRRDYEVV